MIDALKDEIIVNEIAGAKAVVDCFDTRKQQSLINLGFAKSEDSFVCAISSSKHREDIVKSLLGLSALFSTGRDWSPAELLEFYREKGIINGKFRVIAWLGSSKYRIEDR